MARLGVLVILIIALQSGIASAQGGGARTQKDQDAHIVTGTLEELDLSNRKGMIKTDLGKPVFFEITKPQLFKNLTVGGRVTIQLDDRGRADKVIETPIPELKQPLPPTQ